MIKVLFKVPATTVCLNVKLKYIYIYYFLQLFGYGLSSVDLGKLSRLTYI